MTRKIFIKIAPIALACWLAVLLAGPAAANTSAHAPQTVVVIYTADDEEYPGEFDSIIAGIASNPDIVVSRVPLELALDTTNLAQRLQSGLKLAAGPTSGGIAVIYPDIGEPYRSIFTKIIEGIEDQAKTRVASFAVGADVNAQDFANELRRQDIRVVIALGRHGLKAASTLDRGIGVVAGGVISVPDTEGRNLSVLSLAPDPALLFGRLKTLMPAVRRVYVVYDPRQNNWLIRLAREAAVARGVELVAYEAQDLKGALRVYQEILAAADPKKDAIWLPQDSTTVDEASVLPLVLQGAWNNSLAVFSSSVSHVRRGALFSLYPDNVGLGRNLASSALGYLSSGSQPARGMTPLREVLVAVNVRTANHLGLNLGGRQQSFDMVFPEQ